MVEYVNGTIHAPGLLRQREFSELSKALDHLVAAFGGHEPGRQAHAAAPFI